MHTNVTQKAPQDIKSVVTQQRWPSRLGSDTRCPWALARPALQNTNNNGKPSSRFKIVYCHKHNYGSSRWQLNSCVSGSFNSAIKRKVSTREGELRLNKQKTILTWIIRIK